MLGSGVFKKIAPVAAELHSSSWILLMWLAAGIITLFGALSNGEVAGLPADTGGVLFISLLILISTPGYTNASILTRASPYYAMARQGLFFRGTDKLNSRNVPSASLL